MTGSLENQFNKLRLLGSQKELTIETGCIYRQGGIMFLFRNVRLVYSCVPDWEQARVDEEVGWAEYDGENGFHPFVPDPTSISV